MERRFVRSVFGAALAAVAAYGCSDVTGPDALAGTYKLVRYEGAPLPAVTIQGAGFATFIVGERIVLGDNGRGVITTTTRAVDAAHPQGTTVAGSYPATYVIEGDGRIAITYVCPPTADCIAGPHLVGERTASGLALGRPVSSRPASLYERVR